MIESDIPIPPIRRNTNATLRRGKNEQLRVLAFDGKVGDSALFEGARVGTINSQCRNVAGAGWFTCRALNKGVRVWKKAEPTQSRETFVRR